MDLERMNCLRMAFSSSMRFFSSASLGFTFLFSSNIHLNSSRCCSSGIGARCKGGVIGDAIGFSGITAGSAAPAGVEVDVELVEAMSGVSDSDAPVLLFLVLVRTYAPMVKLTTSRSGQRNL